MMILNSRLHTNEIQDYNFIGSNNTRNTNTNNIQYEQPQYRTPTMFTCHWTTGCFRRRHVSHLGGLPASLLAHDSGCRNSSCTAVCCDGVSVYVAPAVCVTVGKASSAVNGVRGVFHPARQHAIYYKF